MLDAHSDIVGQFDVVDVLTLTLNAILKSDVVFDFLALYDVVVDHGALCISLLDGLLSFYAACIFVDDVVAIAMSNFAVVDAEAASVVAAVASLVGVASLLLLPPSGDVLSLSDFDLS